MKKKKRFANAVVIACLAMGALVTGAVLFEYHRLATPPPTALVSILLGFWGGELLILAARQVFGSDAVTRTAKKTLAVTPPI